MDADNLYRNLMTLYSVYLDCFEPCSLRKKDQGFICKICVKCDLIYTFNDDFFKCEFCSACYLQLCMANEKEVKIITMIEQMLQAFLFISYQNKFVIDENFHLLKHFNLAVIS